MEKQTRHTYIGASVPRLDARDKVLGQVLYPADVDRPGTLQAGLILAGRPRARILNIDTAPALALPGVRAVFTAADVPNNTCGLIVPDQPVLCGERVYHVGDKVALIVAETVEVVEQARQLVRIDYEELPPVTDPEMALAADAPLVHPEHSSNLILETRFAKGDAAAAITTAEVIVENTYRTAGQEHAFLAPEAGLAYVDEEGCVVVETAGQWAHDDRRQIAAALNLPEDRVRVIYRAIGGAFGGREDISVQIVLALAAWKLQQPVRMVWTRQESMLAHHKRHPVIYRARLGATRTGQLVAAQIDVLADGGAYVSTSMPVLANAMLFCTGPYHIPNVEITGRVVYTNNPPSGAMRGFGALQANFCAEMQMARLAEALHMDPVQLRAMNLVHEASTLPNGAALPEGMIGAGQTLTWAARAAGWRRQGDDQRTPEYEANNGHRRRGRGFAAGWKNVGLGGGVPDHAEAIVELHGGSDIEQVIVRNAAAEVGQGVQTVLAQIVAEVVGMPLDRIRIIGSDTCTSPPSGTASASRLTLMAGNATRQAALHALDVWHQREERPAIGHGRYDAPDTQPVDATLPGRWTHYSLGYTAGSAEVEIDLETGQVTVLSFVSALDAGRAINPQQVQGQTRGGITQAMGWTLSEKLQVRDGHLLTRDFSTYLIPTILDMPSDIQCIIVETADPHGPFGARGIGELPMLTVAPAILDAIHDATGIWLDHVPVLAEDIWRAYNRLEPPQ